MNATTIPSPAIARPTEHEADCAMDDIYALDQSTFLDLLSDDDLKPFAVMAAYLGQPSADALIRRHGGYFQTVESCLDSLDMVVRPEAGHSPDFQSAMLAAANDLGLPRHSWTFAQKAAIIRAAQNRLAAEDRRACQAMERQDMLAEMHSRQEAA